MNDTGEYSIGTYTIEAAYDTFLNATTVNMLESQQIALTLSDFNVPDLTSMFPTLIILPLLVLAIIVIVIVYRRKAS